MMSFLTVTSLAVTAYSSAISTLMLIGIVMMLPLLYLIDFYFNCKRHQAATPWLAQDKIVVITGASSGIGEELAYEFARQGAKLILCARRIDKLTNVAKKCQDKYGVEAVVFKVDVTRESDIIRLVENIETSYERIDCLVLNAGVSMGERLEDIEDFDVIKTIMDVNYTGSIAFTFHSLPLLKKAAKSRIVIVSSLVGIIPHVPLRTGYAASKCALRGFFESLQAEIVEDNIFITVAYPGIVETEINQNRVGKNPKNIDFNRGMSAEKCSKMIVDGIIKGQKEIILTNIGKIGRIIEGIFPDLLIYLSYNESKKFICANEKKDQ